MVFILYPTSLPLSISFRYFFLTALRRLIYITTFKYICQAFFKKNFKKRASPHVPYIREANLTSNELCFPVMFSLSQKHIFSSLRYIFIAISSEVLSNFSCVITVLIPHDYVTQCFFGASDGIRTHGLQSRSLTLYPAKLRTHKIYSESIHSPNIY